MSDFGSHPLFHDVIGVIGHLLYYDQGVWVKDATILICLHSTNRPLLLQHVRGNYLECPCNHLNLQTGFSNNLKHRSKHRGGQLQQSKQATASQRAQVLLCSKFLESDLKLKSWMKASAGAYVSKLRKRDVRDILYFWVTADLWDSCHKPTRDTAPVMSPNLIWLYFKNLIMKDGNSKESCLLANSRGQQSVGDDQQRFGPQTTHQN